MRVNDAGRAIIKQYEACRLNAYKCPAGRWTIGYGHTGDVVPGSRITQHQAEVIFEYDLDRFEDLISKVVTAPINQNQFSALVSFVFNVGPGKEGEKDGLVTLTNGRPSTLLRLVNAEQPLAAAEEFLKWVHVKGEVFPGLVKRRAAERALFLELPA